MSRSSAGVAGRMALVAGIFKPRTLLLLALVAPIVPRAVAAQDSAAVARYYKHSYALVVGVSHYADSTTWHSEAGTRKDAEGLAGLLRKQGFRVISLYDQQATYLAIRSAVYDSIVPRLQWDDRVLFFFSGHGTTRTQGAERLGYLVPYDGGSGVGQLLSRFDLESFSGAMKTAKHQLFILNSCFSGAFATLGNAGAEMQTLVDTVYLDAVTGWAARQVITAGGKDQEVRAEGPEGYTYFGYYLLEALRGRARDIGGFITFLEMTTWLSPNATTREQTPVVGRFPGDEGGQFLFASPRAANRHVAVLPIPRSAFLSDSVLGTAALGPAVPVAFSFTYTFSDPHGEGKRDWIREGDSWIEHFPDSTQGRSRVIDRTNVDGDNGTLLRSVNSQFEYFIPDKGSKLMWLRMRLTGGAWGYVGEMHDVK